MVLRRFRGRLHRGVSSLPRIAQRQRRQRFQRLGRRTHSGYSAFMVEEPGQGLGAWLGYVDSTVEEPALNPGGTATAYQVATMPNVKVPIDANLARAASHYLEDGGNLTTVLRDRMGLHYLVGIALDPIDGSAPYALVHSIHAHNAADKIHAALQSLARWGDTSSLEDALAIASDTATTTARQLVGLDQEKTKTPAWGLLPTVKAAALLYAAAKLVGY